MLRGPQKWLKKEGVLRSVYLVRFAAVTDSAHEKRHVWSHIGKLLAVQIWKIYAASVVATEDELMRSKEHAPA
jgi:hypothetical protein